MAELEMDQEIMVEAIEPREIIPRKKPGEYRSSQRVTVTMTTEFWLQCLEKAEKEYKTVNAWILDLVRQRVLDSKEAARHNSEQPRL
jgi:hypothetical protein